MQNLGPMSGTLLRTAQYQNAWVNYMPGYGVHSFSITIEVDGRRVGDTFHIESDKDLNSALNILHKRAYT